MTALHFLFAALWLLFGVGVLRAAEPSALDRALLAQDNNELAKATALYGEALADPAIAPDTAVLLRHNRALAYLQLDRHDDAVADLAAALQAVPNNAAALYLRGVTRLRKGQVPTAREDFSAVLAAEPGNTAALVGRATSHLLEGDAKGALADLSKVPADGPDAALAASLRGHARAALRQHQRAVEAFNAALAQDPMLVSAYAGRAFSLSGQGEHARAEGDYSLAIAIEPDFAEAYRGRAEVRRRLGQREAAVADFDQALTLDPYLSEALVGRGLVLRSLGRFDGAAADFAAAIGTDPVNVEAYAARGTARFYMGQFLSASRDYRRALGLQAANPYSVLWLFLAQERAGFDGAKELDRNAGRLKLKPGRWPHPVLAFFRGQATAERLIQATRHENRRRERERQCEAFFYLGQFYLLSDDPKLAKKYFQKTLETGITGFIEYLGAEVELRRL